ncbi:MAG TPA: hypothetical protein VFM55_22530, partial [Micromonosporaceae bacterium]|nr:hypothetical protein [Micromonosporaceae bacterium]HET8661757.1 hypothetical protein [Micromonosporaceae bacterium]
VRIRRIFIFDRPEVLEDLNFLEVYRKHQSFGIEVRVLGLANPMVRFTSVVDFVVFDGVVSYETTSATSVRDRPPLIVQTRLIREPGWVRDRIHRFEELWEQGEELGSAEIPA